MNVRLNQRAAIFRFGYICSSLMYAKAYAQDGAMRAAFEYFKAFDRQDAEDNRKFAAHKLPMPVLVIAGDKSMGDALEIQARIVSDNVTAIKFVDTGHWLMEERPAETKAALKKFFSLTARDLSR